MMGVGAKRAIGLYRSCAPRQLAGDGLELHVFPGTPNTTFESPSVEVLAAKVRDCLRASQESVAPDTATR